MRRAGLLLIATTLSIAAPAAAQVSVTAPAAGKESSYRKTTISWAPIPGAASYHLEIDDDPNFGSPEVDVTVAGTSYTLSGERLELNGQLSWAAYVRINGKRWNANTFTPSYFSMGQTPALGVNSQNKLYIAFQDAQDRIQLTTSSDWSSVTRLSLADTFNTYGLNLAVDEQDVAHASWIEQRPTESWVPYYAKSSTGWNLVRIPGTTSGGCSEGSIVAGGGQVDLFYDACAEGIERWTTTDGLAFTRTQVPNNDSATSASAGRDGFGNLYVASERDTLDDMHSSVQTSADGWIPHRLGPGRAPALAVTPTGGVHVLRWSDGDDGLPGTDFLYSNSLRAFQTWTKLPTTSTAAFDQDILPLIVDETGDQLHAALPALNGIQLCSAPNTGSANDTGTSWSCSTVGKGDATSPDLALAPDGTLHLAWRGFNGLGYANSLGSFLATNSTPQVSFGAPSGGPSAVTVPVRISDVDGDEMAGHIQVGRYQPVMSFIGRGATDTILDGRYTLAVDSGSSSIYDVSGTLQFRILGTATWVSALLRSALTIPAQVEVRDRTGQIIGGFFIAGWDGTGATIVKNGFVPYQKLTFEGALPSEIDISPLPAGAAMVAIGLSDRSSSSFAAQAFTKASGQTRLLLTKF